MIGGLGSAAAMAGDDAPVTAPAEIRFRDMGDTAFAVEFGTGIDRAVNARVMALRRAVAALSPEGLVETIPSFGALVVCYDPLRTSRAELQAGVAGLLTGLEATQGGGRLWEIPVCYAPAFAPDLAGVAQRCRLSEAEIVARHSSTRFFIYMLGFMPGLAYMGGLEAALQLPRRGEPRLKVPAGSVAIAEAMTTIYPWDSPGGWHLIGRTPIRLFDQTRADPILYAAGDEVGFRAITEGEYDALAARVAAGSFDHATLERPR